MVDVQPDLGREVEGQLGSVQKKRVSRRQRRSIPDDSHLSDARHARESTDPSLSSEVCEMYAGEQAQERRAPNGRLAVLIGNLWAGVAATRDRSAGRKEFGCFSVQEVDNKLIARWVRDCTPDEKKSLSKKYYRDRSIFSLDAIAANGRSCQLFTS